MIEAGRGNDVPKLLLTSENLRRARESASNSHTFQWVFGYALVQ